MPSSDLRTLYPEANPNQEYTLPVDEQHSLYLVEYGNPHGIPVVYCHGGPGAGLQAKHARYFDPARYRIVLFDQRGAGRSTPKGCLENNTTTHLIKDMEKIRDALDIQQWVVGGGSWGTTLSLLYAQTYPKRVLSLLLRGIFLAREQDIQAYLHDYSPAANKHPIEWLTFKAETHALLEKAHINTTDPDNYIPIYYQLLRHHDPTIRQQAAKAMSRWEMQNASQNAPDEQDMLWAESADGINMGLTETTYMYHHCFIRENQILDNVAKISAIPAYVIHGKQDLICPIDQAKTLCAALPSSAFYATDAGHSGSEPATISAMVNATDVILEQLHQRKR